MKVAIIGGSNGGYAMAADLTLQGHEVGWYVRDPDRHGAVLESRSLELTGVGVTGRADISFVSQDLEQVLAFADDVLVPLPSFAHWAIIEELAPKVRDGHTVIFTPGTLLSSVAARAVQRSINPGREVTWGESATLPYGTRRTGQTRVNLNCLVTHNPLATIPASRTEETVERFRLLYPTFLPAIDVLDAALNNQAPMTQPAGMLLNTGYVENVRSFHLHRDGVTSSVLRVEEAVDRERVALRRAFGYGPPDYPLKEFYRPGSTDDRALFSQVIEQVNETNDYEEFYDTWMPYEGVQHRYFIEACGEGLCFLHSLAMRIGLAVPLMSSIIELASVVAQSDYNKVGRTTEKVGITGHTVEEILAEIRD